MRLTSFIKPVLWLSLLLYCVFGFFSSQVLAFGGPNKVLQNMEKMVERLNASEELTEEETRQWRRAIEYLYQQVEKTIQENQNNGINGLNPQRDSALYDEINRYSQPLYELYNDSQAKQADPTIKYPSPSSPPDGY
jgi:hypothetical protein